MFFEKGGMVLPHRYEELDDSSKIVMIAALGPNGLIGKDGTVPWKSKKDLERFKNLTQGHTVIMGSKTWESLPNSVKPLPGRLNIVMSRDPYYDAGTRDAELTFGGMNVEQAFRKAALYKSYSDKIFIIGGAEIYDLFSPVYDELLISWFPTDVEGDTHFKKMNEMLPYYEHCYTNVCKDHVFQRFVAKHSLNVTRRACYEVWRGVISHEKA